jgi:hypothetical protein
VLFKVNQLPHTNLLRQQSLISCGQGPVGDLSSVSLLLEYGTCPPSYCR